MFYIDRFDNHSFGFSENYYKPSEGPRESV